MSAGDRHDRVMSDVPEEEVVSALTALAESVRQQAALAATLGPGADPRGKRELDILRQILEWQEEARRATAVLQRAGLA